MNTLHQEMDTPRNHSFEAPSAWNAMLKGYSWDPQTIGRSAAAVLRLVADGRPTLFAKAEMAGAFGTTLDAERIWYHRLLDEFF